MAAQQLQWARLQIVEDLSDPNIMSIADILLHKKVINKFEMDSITHITLERAGRARKLVDMVTCKGNMASMTMLEALMEVDPHLFNMIKDNYSAQAYDIAVQAGAQAARDAPPNYDDVIQND